MWLCVIQAPSTEEAFQVSQVWDQDSSCAHSAAVEPISGQETVLTPSPGPRRRTHEQALAGQDVQEAGSPAPPLAEHLPCPPTPQGQREG